MKRRTIRCRFIGSLFIFLIMATGISAYDPPTILVTDPDGLDDTIGESDDFATIAIGDPWDCSQPTDFSSYIFNFSDPRFENSQFKGVSNADTPKITIQYQGNSITQPIGRTGQNFPINTAKYTHYAMRMYLSRKTSFQLLWFFDDLDVTNPNKKSGSSEFIQGHAGWNTYLIDLTSLDVINDGGYKWRAFSQVYGLRLDPHNTPGVSNVNVKIDWIRLCQSTDSSCRKKIKWNATIPNSRAVVSLYADLDSNFSNGYHCRIATGLNAALGEYTWMPHYMPPEDYYIHGIIGEDYPDIIMNDPWDMDSGGGDCDPNNFSGVSFNSGIFRGTSNTTNPWIELQLHPDYPIDANLFKSLSVRMNVQNVSNYNVYWRKQGQSTYYHSAYADSQTGWHNYTINLGACDGWSGKIDYLRLVPSRRSGEYVQIDWVTLATSSANNNNPDSRNESASSGPLSINACPIVHILDPDRTGQEDFSSVIWRNPWDMHDPADVDRTSGMTDCRFSEGVFSGRSTSNDPIVYLLDQGQGTTINTARYKNLSFTMKVSGEWSIHDGSVGRFLWRSPWENRDTCSMSVLLFPGHDGCRYSTNEFVTYVVDLEEALLEPANGTFFATPWNQSSPHEFRIDPHEFPDSRVSSLSSVRLTADDESTGTFTLRWDDLDPDSNATLSFYYDTNAQGYNGQQIVAGLHENDPQDSYRWTTSTLPQGTYYVYAMISDDYNTCGRYATGPIKIISPQDNAPPFVSNRYPKPNSTGASPYTRISVHVMDAGKGVDASSLSLRVNGNTVTPVRTGTPGDFKLVYDPAGSFDFSELVQITVQADDLCTPSHHLNASYSFRITGAGDSDSDGLPNAWEEANGLDPNLGNGEHGANGDADGDGRTNIEEYQQGTDPTSPYAIITGPGAGAPNDTNVRTFDNQGNPLATDFSAYAGVTGYGVNIACGDVDRDGIMEIITGPGPGLENPPEVRIFEPDGSYRASMTFAAYGVMKFGVHVAAGDLDNDGRAELITGPGPAAVFGPHVRGWSCKPGTPVPMGDISFFSYGTKKFGVNVSAGDVDGDGYDEILTGAGPGAVFGPHVRSWNYDGQAIDTMRDVNFFAYGTRKWGVNVSAGDVERDGRDEIITGPGPGQVFGPHVRAWNYTQAAGIKPITGISYFAYGTSKYGVIAAPGDFDGDGYDEIVTGPGPGSMFGPQIRGWNYDGTALTATSLNFFAYSSTVYRFGANVALGHIDY